MHVKILHGQKKLFESLMGVEPRNTMGSLYLYLRDTSELDRSECERSNAN